MVHGRMVIMELESEGLCEWIDDDVTWMIIQKRRRAHKVGLHATTQNWGASFRCCSQSANASG